MMNSKITITPLPMNLFKRKVKVNCYFTTDHQQISIVRCGSIYVVKMNRDGTYGSTYTTVSPPPKTRTQFVSDGAPKQSQQQIFQDWMIEAFKDILAAMSKRKVMREENFPILRIGVVPSALQSSGVGMTVFDENPIWAPPLTVNTMDELFRSMITIDIDLEKHSMVSTVDNTHCMLHNHGAKYNVRKHSVQPDGMTDADHIFRFVPPTKYTRSPDLLTFRLVADSKICGFWEHLVRLFEITQIQSVVRFRHDHNPQNLAASIFATGNHFSIDLAGCHTQSYSIGGIPVEYVFEYEPYAARRHVPTFTFVSCLDPVLNPITPSITFREISPELVPDLEHNHSEGESVGVRLTVINIPTIDFSKIKLAVDTEWIGTSKAQKFRLYGDFHPLVAGKCVFDYHRNMKISTDNKWTKQLRRITRNVHLHHTWNVYDATLTPVFCRACPIEFPDNTYILEKVMRWVKHNPIGIPPRTFYEINQCFVRNHPDAQMETSVFFHSLPSTSPNKSDYQSASTYMETQGLGLEYIELCRAIKRYAKEKAAIRRPLHTIPIDG